MHSHDERQRLTVAAEAARLLAEDGVQDWHFAKRKAMDRLGAAASALPGNQAVAQALAEHLSLYGGDEHVQRCAVYRRVAVALMHRLAQFQPLAAGAIVNGLMTPQSPIELHLFADPPEMVDMYLGDQGLPFADEERQLRHPDGRSFVIPVCQLQNQALGRAPIDLLVFPEDAQRWAPLSPIDGRPMQRLTRAALEALPEAPAALR